MTDREYKAKLREINNDKSLDKEQKRRLKEALAQDYYGPKADLSQFNELLGKLEGSKMKQQRQRSAASIVTGKLVY